MKSFLDLLALIPKMYIQWPSLWLNTWSEKFNRSSQTPPGNFRRRVGAEGSRCVDLLELDGVDDSMHIHPRRGLHHLQQAVYPPGILAERHILYMRGSKGS